MIIATIISWIFIKTTSKINFAEMIIRTFLGQSDSILDSLSQMSKISLTNILLFVIWLQSASVLSKAFTGLLLNTFFNVKSVPIVNDFKDIIVNKDINIACDENLLQLFLVIYKYDKDTSDRLQARVTKYQKQVKYRERFHLDNMINDEILNHVINGRTVLLTFTQLRLIYYHHYKLYEDDIAIGEEKYFNMKVFQMVKKSIPISKKLVSL